MGIFAPWSMPSHRNNFEKFMLTMQYHQMMTDLKKMPQEISEALSKSQELTKENHSYWWVTNMVMTQALDTMCLPILVFESKWGLRLYTLCLLKGILPLQCKALGFLPLRHILNKCEESVTPPAIFPFQLSILEIVNICTIMEISINLEPLGLWKEIYTSGFCETYRKIVYILGVFSPREGLLSNYR